MKKIALYLLIAAGVLSSCAKSELVELKSGRTAADGELVFVASADRSADTKTALDGMNINWVAADPVMIFGKDGESNPKVSGYAAHAAGASTTLDWTTNISGTEGAFVTGETPEYALYPTDAENASIDGSVITFKLPETQTYAAGSFGQNANVAVGKITSLEGMADIKFKNVCGYLKLQVSVAEGDAATVGRIVLTTKGTEKLWGTFTADAAEESPVATYKAGATDGSTSVTLNCPDGVAVSTDASNPTVFYIVVPVGALADGFKAEVYSKQDHLMTTLETSNAVTIVKNQVNRMANKSFNWIPATYAECLYIQSDGSQYVDTGVSESNGVSFDIVFQYADYTHLSTIIGAYGPSPSYYGFYMRIYNGSLNLNGSNKVSYYSGGDKSHLYRINVSLLPESSTGFVTDKTSGEQFPIPSKINTFVTRNVTLFASNIGGDDSPMNPKLFASAKLFYCIFRNPENLEVEIRHFIPANNGTKNGLYDIVNREFYTGEGGDFSSEY